MAISCLFVPPCRVCCLPCFGGAFLSVCPARSRHMPRASGKWMWTPCLSRVAGACAAPDVRGKGCCSFPRHGDLRHRHRLSSPRFSPSRGDRPSCRKGLSFWARLFLPHETAPAGIVERRAALRRLWGPLRPGRQEMACREPAAGNRRSRDDAPGMVAAEAHCPGSVLPFTQEAAFARSPAITERGHPRHEPVTGRQLAFPGSP